TSEVDCGTMDGITVAPLVEGGEIVEPIGERILGRVCLEDVVDPFTDEVLAKANQEIDEDIVEKIEQTRIEQVKIRSALTCQAKRGVCTFCYGRDLARGKMVCIGEAVGVIAAQSIGEPGTQLTMRTFHIGGTASRRVEQTTLEVKYEGRVKFIKLNLVKDREGDLVVMNRNGEVSIIDDSGRERERYSIVYGAHLKVADGDFVKAGTRIAEWDPFYTPIVTEVPGKVKFGDIIEGRTMQERLDEVTGFSSKVITSFKDQESRPRVSIKGDSGKTLKLPSSESHARYFMPVGANIMLNEGDEVQAGDVIAKIPRETTKTKDITGGLPRVAELFEARKPKEVSAISEIDGTVSFGKDVKGKRNIIVTPEIGESLEYLIPKSKHISVLEGDKVKAGEPLVDGLASPHDILSILGEKELAKFLVDEVQEVYRLQGVKINDKHIEIMVRQMLRRVKIKEVGDSSFLVGEHVEKLIFEEENEKISKKGGQPAIGEPLLLGITKASLSTESFISAASFQETTKVLTQAAVEGKTDFLRGLKENTAMGKLMPAGTGLTRYSDLGIKLEGEGQKEEQST
ncbi:MAG: DNA-directed RNA polymerase subunit beta', partial [Deltaproteobacteria bacterium]|nr:DNA-directed RNA polymerase subunit beta' [Deltaproteobacteria bacterium]